VQVIATAGHVDHGKSALVRALTGMEPDRWAEERRRGLTIDLGYAWMTLQGGRSLAFVDVPGHERFLTNMLAGVGPVPAVLFVVAADGGWMPQSAEHLAVINALGITAGVLAVTRADLADPAPAMARASDGLAASSLGKVEAVAVSAVTGQGLDELRSALSRLAASLAEPDPGAPVRLWIDRVFTVAGAGTVVTGTLPAGTIRTGDELRLTPSLGQVRVRGIQLLREPVSEASGTSRVALNLRGVPAGELSRGMALISPDGWMATSAADVRLARPGGGGGHGERLPRRVSVHAGSARVTASLRDLGGGLARLTLSALLPLHVGDRLLLRDPGAARNPPPRSIAAGLGPDVPAGTLGPGWPGVYGATVLDVAPPALARRGAAAAARQELASWPDPPTAADLLRRHGLLTRGALTRMGLAQPGQAPGVPGVIAVTVRDGSAAARSARASGEPGEWLCDPGHWGRLRHRLAKAVAAHAARDQLAPGMPAEAARAELGLPDRRLVVALARDPGSPPGTGPDGAVELAAGLLRPRRAAADGPQPATAMRSVSGSPAAALPEPAAAGVRAVLGDLAAAPFRAPDATRLAELGLDTKALAAAARAGLLTRLGGQIVLAPAACTQAAAILARLPQPFTAAEARQALDSTRRTVIPLLEHLDRAGITQRLPDDRRQIRRPSRQRP
jgi:selenocysteine-specific elongation factor